uniref:Uncharacterized protein n=1 Tax=Opuntia streptacantha TaxID=393608 RepID=A0A7C9F367_OPUST
MLLSLSIAKVNKGSPFLNDTCRRAWIKDSFFELGWRSQKPSALRPAHLGLIFTECPGPESDGSWLNFILTTVEDECFLDGSGLLDALDLRRGSNNLLRGLDLLLLLLDDLSLLGLSVETEALAPSDSDLATPSVEPDLRRGEFSLDPAFFIILLIAKLNLRIGDGFLDFGIDSELFLTSNSSKDLAALATLSPAIGFFSSVFLLLDGLLNLLAGNGNRYNA